MGWTPSSQLGSGETLDQNPVPKAAVAHRQRLGVQHREDATHEAAAGEDDLRAFGLKADDLASLVGITLAVELDLAVHPRPVEHRALHDVGVVRRETVTHGG